MVAATNLLGECCARQQSKCTLLLSMYAYRFGKLARRNDQTPPAQSTWAGWPSVVTRSMLRRRQYSAATSNAGLELPVHAPRVLLLLKLDWKGELSRPRGGLAEHARCACSLRSPVSAQMKPQVHSLTRTRHTAWSAVLEWPTLAQAAGAQRVCVQQEVAVHAAQRPRTRAAGRRHAAPDASRLSCSMERGVGMANIGAGPRWPTCVHSE